MLSFFEEPSLEKTGCYVIAVVRMHNSSHEFSQLLFEEPLGKILPKRSTSQKRVSNSKRKEKCLDAL